MQTGAASAVSPLSVEDRAVPAQREGWDRDMACGSCAYIARVRRQSLAAFFFRDLGDDARKSLPDDARWVYID